MQILIDFVNAFGDIILYVIGFLILLSFIKSILILVTGIKTWWKKNYL